jgi:hypothetical protein
VTGRLLHFPPPRAGVRGVPDARLGDYYAVEWGDLLLLVLNVLGHTRSCHALSLRDQVGLRAARAMRAEGMVRSFYYARTTVRSQAYHRPLDILTHRLLSFVGKWRS